jgi:hypothetical protein
MVPGLEIGARAGWAFGASHPLGSLSLASRPGGATGEARFYLNDRRDLGVGPVGSGAMNTLSAVFAGEDHLDPYYVSGASLRLKVPLGGDWTVEGSGHAERQKSALLQSRFSFFGDLRPVRPIDPTDLMLGARAELARTPRAETGSWWSGSLVTEIGAMDPVGGSEAAAAGSTPGFVKPQARVELGRRGGSRELEVRLTARGGVAFGELPQQGLYLIGGRGTLPGYEFRSFGGGSFATANATASMELWRPWLRGRVLGGLGWAGVGEGGREALARSGSRTTATLRPSLGVGFGVFHDIVRVDLARGLADDGIWELIVEANPSFWDFL